MVSRKAQNQRKWDRACFPSPPHAPPPNLITFACCIWSRYMLSGSGEPTAGLSPYFYQRLFSSENPCSPNCFSYLHTLYAFRYRHPVRPGSPRSPYTTTWRRPNNCRIPTAGVPHAIHSRSQLGAHHLLNMYIFSSALVLPTLKIAFTNVNILGWLTIHALDVCVLTIRSIGARTAHKYPTRPSFHETYIPFGLMLNHPWRCFLRYQSFCLSGQLPISPPRHFPNVLAQYGYRSGRTILER